MYDSLAATQLQDIEQKEMNVTPNELPLRTSGSNLAIEEGLDVPNP